MDLLLTRPNRNRYFAFSTIFIGILENSIETSEIPNLLTKNYLQQMLNTFKTSVGKNKDKDFQQITQKLFEALLDALKKDTKDKTKIKVLKKLLFYPGCFVFEKITKSKLIQNITATLNQEGVKKLSKIYRDVILAKTDRVINEEITEKWWNTDRIYASHLLVKLINHQSVNGENDWKISQLIFLMELALLPNDEIGQELADSLKETFYNSLDLKLNKLEDLRFILSQVTCKLNEIIENRAVLRHPLTDNELEMWHKTIKLATKIQNKKRKAVFHTLFLHLGLQLFNNAKLASDSLSELFSCYDRMKKTKTNDTTTESVNETNEENKGDPLWIEVVVDLFLNLLSHSSHLLRSVINCVFPHLCAHMNATALHQILAVLDPKNEENPLSKYGEDDDSDESDEDETKDDEEKEDSSEEDEDEDEDDTTNNDKLRLALQQILGEQQDDVESVNLDDLDEENGEKLDAALGQVFKQFKPNLGQKKKKQTKDDETLMHFRIRVLDLIEIYLNNDPSMILTLEIMLPLLQILEFCIRDAHQKPIQDRVNCCLKKLSSLKKFSDCSDVSEDLLLDLLTSLLDRGTKNAIIVQDMGEKIAECCVFVINCSEVVRNLTEKKRKSKIYKIIKQHLELFFEKRDCLTPYVLFKTVIQMNWVGVLKLIPILMGFIFAPSVRPFRRNQALELLKLFYNNHRFFKTHKDELVSIQDCQTSFLQDTLGFCKEFVANPTERKIKEKFICSLFGLLYEIKASNCASDFPWEQIGQNVTELRSYVTISKDTKVAFNKLCRSLNLSNVVKMKPTTFRLNNLEDEGSVNGGKEEVVKEKTKKRKGADKDALKQKKESKQIRLESLSEGLSSKRKIGLENGNGDEEMNGDVEVKRKKKKKSLE